MPNEEEFLKRDVEFHERVLDMITSRDPGEAFRGRVARALFAKWAEAFSDHRNLPATEFLAALTELSAWLVASTAIYLVKGTRQHENEFKKLFMNDFSNALSRALDFHLMKRRKERHEDIPHS